MTSLRACASGRPGNGIRLPGTKPAGSMSQASSEASSQTTPEALSADEYRVKPAAVPAFRPTTPARLGPVHMTAERHRMAGDASSKLPRAAFRIAGSPGRFRHEQDYDPGHRTCTEMHSPLQDAYGGVLPDTTADPYVSGRVSSGAERDAAFRRNVRQIDL